ncbi:EAP30/Vps36 family-domain-containing protein [Entophlyctis helioformis]|nr:EAP30/Vps36 family-domain-containing protein [Entophlyctis helioformis]
MTEPAQRQMQTLLATFKSNLEEFAQKHKKDIRRDPVFRMHFQRMCNNVGVDPLASNKGFWSDILGFGDFYYELGVQIAEVCLATRESNGGLIDLIELKRLVEKTRGKNAQPISEDDIVRSIKTLKPLGNGFDVIKIGNRSMVQSVPRELDVDFSTALSMAQEKGCVSVQTLKDALGWEEERATKVLDNLLKDGICWIDMQEHPPTYWVSGLLNI